MADGPGSYEYFSHTADVGLLARGETLGQAFGNAALGLSALMVELASVEPRQERVVHIKGDSLEDLLVAWLTELLFLFDSEGFVGVRFDVELPTQDSLRAIVAGERFDPERHQIKSGIKAATYHDVTVFHEQGWTLRVILDL